LLAAILAALGFTGYVVLLPWKLSSCMVSSLNQYQTYQRQPQSTHSGIAIPSFINNRLVSMKLSQHVVGARFLNTMYMYNTTV